VCIKGCETSLTLQVSLTTQNPEAGNMVMGPAEPRTENDCAGETMRNLSEIISVIKELPLIF
jgi:hypothetical protein